MSQTLVKITCAGGCRKDTDEERVLMTHVIRGMLQRHSVLAFFALSYTISWIIWLPLVVSPQSGRPLLILGSFGPAISTLLLTAINSGKAGLREFLRRFLIWRVGAIWYIFSLFVGAAVILAAIDLHVLLGGDSPAFNDPAQLYLVAPIFLYVLLFSVLGEEVGWRGYALQRLQADRSALSASLIIGLAWGFWHLPLFWMKGNFHQEIPLGLFMLQSIALAILFTWVYNNTRGSLLIIHLFHAAGNTALGVLPILPMDTGGDLRPLWFAVGLLWCVTLAVIIIFGPASLLRRPITQTES